MKKCLCTILALVLTLSLISSCEQKKQSGISDFSGTWKQINSNSNDSYQEAIISDNSIEVYWVLDNGDTRSLYWAGSYVAPNKSVTEYSWTSINDHEKTDWSLLASSDDTKIIRYKDGQLYWEASAFGSTITVKLEKIR